MPRLFNTAGPCDPAKHYMLPALGRLPEVARLVEEERYFVLHAPRQSGKTTAIRALARELTQGGRYAAVTLSSEAGARSPPGVDAEATLLHSWRVYAQAQLPPELLPPPWPPSQPGVGVLSALTLWAQGCARPLAVFIDEIDMLPPATLSSVLAQLRSGASERPKSFPWSLALVGLRDIRDYKLAAGGSERLGGGSPFNILSRSLTLRPFTRDEIAELYAQHTADTGQVFLPDAVGRAWHWTEGQPWLVNALAQECVESLVPDRSRAITAADIDSGKQAIILRKETHLDSLGERLREERVRQVMEPVLSGDTVPAIPDDDVEYVLDLGLLRRAQGGGLVVANPIYKEVIPRVLAQRPQDSLPQIAPTWLKPDGTLDPDRLLQSFLEFWREHAEPLFKSAPYAEIAPHLVLMAFLHRVVNGGGRIDREYSVGSGRMDLCVRYGAVTLAMELKVHRRTDPLQEGLAQLDRYLDGLSLPTGWLVIFDRRVRAASVAKRTKASIRKTPAGRKVTVIRA